MNQRHPVLPADLTCVKVNGGRGYGNIVNWDEDDAPFVGQQVQAADEFPDFVRPIRVTA